jgi:hypothetical protein
VKHIQVELTRVLVVWEPHHGGASHDTHDHEAVPGVFLPVILPCFDCLHFQIIFLFFGLVTMVVAVIMFFWMPDSPTEAKFLSDDDKVLAIERLRSNHMGVMSREWRYAQFFEAFWDIKTWLWIALIFAISVPSNGISTFGPLIIQSFVSDPYKTMLFNVPVGISHIVAVSGSAYLSMKLKMKGPVIVLLCIPPLVGFSILLSYEHSIENRAILLVGYFCLSTFTGISKAPSPNPRKNS